MMLHFDDIVFGPVSSRRLGSSLGVNILPLKGKLCNFDCIYCECGWNKDGIALRKFPSAIEVEAALKDKMVQTALSGVDVDSITFSGNGEPTLNPEFAKIVDIVLKLRDRYYPKAKVSVLSNATMLGRPDVMAALMKTDNPILKLDAGEIGLIRGINRPSGHYDFEEVIRNMESFQGNFILQTMFMKSSEYETTAPDMLLKWYDIVRRLRPREIMVYTIDRETPDKNIGKYTEADMKGFVQPLIDEGFNIQISG